MPASNRERHSSSRQRERSVMAVPETLRRRWHGPSSNTAIATINSTGLATGIAYGTVAISGNRQCYITTTNFSVGSQTATITSVAVSPASAAIAIGNTQQFVATAANSNGTRSVITSAASWTSSDSTIATVSSGGLATGVTSGTVTITASSGSVQGSATLAVQ
jgi:hypothetical protein